MELHVPAGHAGNIQHRWRLQLLAELHLLIAYGKHTIKHHPIVNIATRDFGATTRSAAAGTIAACPKQNSEKCYLNVTNKRKWPRDRDIFQNRPSGRQFNRFLPLNPIKTATYQRFLLVKNDVDSICRSPNGRAGGRGEMKENEGELPDEMTCEFTFYFLFWHRLINSSRYLDSIQFIQNW